MAYTCPGEVTPRVNLFSNPDISYLGRVTGTETEDNARTIADNMVRCGGCCDHNLFTSVFWAG